MKKIVYTLIAAALIVSCQEKEKTNLDKLRHEKDSLVTLQAEMIKRIKTIDSEIAKLDSTKKLNTVTAIALEPTTFKHHITVYGVVESNQSINLYAESSGRIESIKVSRGENVVKGQLLAVIDGTMIEKNIAEVKTSLELANEIYSKQSRLWLEEKIGSEVQYLEAKNNKEALERRLETLKHQLSMTKVRAPFNGIIDDIFPKAGEMAAPQMEMFRLVNLGNVYLTASVSEAYVSSIGVGTPAKVHFSSIDNELESEVIRVGHFINPDNRTFEVNVSLDSHHEYKPNMMGSVLLEDYSADSSLVVPARIIMENTEGESYVYVYENEDSDVSEVKKVMIEIGMTYEGMTEVVAGLEGHELIVDKGSRSVKDGQKVRLVKG